MKGKNKNKNPKGNGKVDPSRIRKAKNIRMPVVDTDAYSTEMLRIQGLMLCQSCKNPCPLDLVICPTCGFEYKGD